MIVRMKEEMELSRYHKFVMLEISKHQFEYPRQDYYTISQFMTPNTSSFEILQAVKYITSRNTRNILYPFDVLSSILIRLSTGDISTREYMHLEHNQIYSTVYAINDEVYIAVGCDDVRELYKSKRIKRLFSTRELRTNIHEYIETLTDQETEDYFNQLI
jgi:hypothetical protein